MGLSQFTEIQWAKLTESRGAGSEFAAPFVPDRVVLAAETYA